MESNYKIQKILGSHKTLSTSVIYEGKHFPNIFPVFETFSHSAQFGPNFCIILKQNNGKIGIKFHEKIQKEFLLRSQE
jgi:hypothetical protein